MNVYLMPLIFILIIAAIYGLGILAGKAEKWLERKED